MRPDLYEKHPRADLTRRASGEAMAELEEQIEGLEDRLAPFKCPTCGAPLCETRRVTHESGDDMIEMFECGYQAGGGRPCPSDPKFPTFDDYELQLKYFPDASRWSCYAIPRTQMPFGQRPIRVGAASGSQRWSIRSQPPEEPVFPVNAHPAITNKLSAVARRIVTLVLYAVPGD
jgi:hypothetical protein